MASKDLINLGVSPDSGTGDSARRGGQKINNIFADVYTNFGDNPIGNDPTAPFYGYRRTFTEWEYKVGELHPAGRWPVVKFKTPAVGDSDRLYTAGWGYGVDNTGAFVDADGSGTPDIYEDSEWYFLSRGEQVCLDLTEVSNGNDIHIVLPLAKMGDVVKIRDVRSTWALKTLNVWTTPYEFTTDAQLAEWVTNTPETNSLAPDSDAWSISNDIGELKASSYKKVATLTTDPRVNADFVTDPTNPKQSPINLSNIENAEVTFLYRGPDLGWNYRITFNQNDNATVAVGGNVPVSPWDGKLWFNDSEGVMYVYYSKANAWVQANPASDLAILRMERDSEISAVRTITTDLDSDIQNLLDTIDAGSGNDSDF